ncbi:MAG: hypothetical protein ACLP01_25350 [Solirubrobacteraceae bacterium]
MTTSFPTNSTQPAAAEPEPSSRDPRVRDVLSPREVAVRAGFSYHAILRAIRRGDLQAYEPVPGHYRIELVEYERWLRHPARREEKPPPPEYAPRPRHRRVSADPSRPGSMSRLRAIEES